MSNNTITMDELAKRNGGFLVGYDPMYGIVMYGANRIDLMREELPTNITIIKYSDRQSQTTGHESLVAVVKYNPNIKELYFYEWFHEAMDHYNKENTTKRLVIR